MGSVTTTHVIVGPMGRIFVVNVTGLGYIKSSHKVCVVNELGIRYMLSRLK